MSAAGDFAHLDGITFADASHGWAVGRNKNADRSPAGRLILATRDGGTTWKVQNSASTDSNGQLNSVVFTDTSHGWAVGGHIMGEDDSGDGIILATRDGGTTWNAQDASGAGAEASLKSVSFVDATHGWAVGSRPLNNGTYSTGAVILATSDGGASWVVQNAGGAGGNGRLNSVVFTDASNGWAVGVKWGSDNYSAGGIILATSDGGATWKEQDASGAGTGNLKAVAFADTSHGWAVGSGGRSGSPKSTGPVILATADGGASWKAQDASAADSTGGLSAVSFPDAMHGWVGGHSWDDSTQSSTGYILATDDGGVTWKEQDSSAAGGGDSNSIYFVDAAHGWAVGTRRSGGTATTPFILAATR